jgi:hypothetical protein
MTLRVTLSANPSTWPSQGMADPVGCRPFETPGMCSTATTNGGFDIKTDSLTRETQACENAKAFVQLRYLTHNNRFTIGTIGRRGSLCRSCQASWLIPLLLSHT